MPLRTFSDGSTLARLLLGGGLALLVSATWSVLDVRDTETGPPAHPRVSSPRPDSADRASERPTAELTASPSRRVNRRTDDQADPDRGTFTDGGAADAPAHQPGPTAVGSGGPAEEAIALAAATARPQPAERVGPPAPESGPDLPAATRTPFTIEGRATREAAVSPGGVYTAAFLVTNPGRRERSARGILEVPPGWRSALPLRPFTVGPGRTSVQIVSVQVPPNAPPGHYTLRFSVEGATALGAMPVTVLESHGLLLEAETVPSRVVSGDPLTITVLLANTGNVPATIDLDALSNLGLALSLDVQRVRLGPRESRRITVTSERPRPALRPLRHIVRVRARDGHSEQTVTAATDIMPPPGQPLPHDGALDAHVALRGVRAGGGASIQVDGAGAMPLWGGTLDAALTAPDQRRGAVYRDRSHYSLRYRREGLVALAGDHVYRLSPLTEQGGYGFGAGAEVGLGGVQFGGFSHRRRYSVDGESAHGAYLGVRLRRGADVRANVLRRDGYRSGTVATLRTTLGDQASYLDAECGLGTNTIGGGGTTRACAARLIFDRAWISYRATALSADVGFPGRFAGPQMLSMSAAVRPTRWARIEGSFQNQRRESFAIARSSRRHRLGGALMGWPGRVGLYSNSQEIVGGLGGLRRETSAEAFVATSRGALRVRASAEVGRISAEPDASWLFNRAQGHLRLAPSPGRTAHLGAEYRRGGTLYRPTARRQWRAEAGAAVRALGRTRVSAVASVAVEEDAEGRRNRYGYAQGMIEHVLPSGHRIAAEGRALTSTSLLMARTSAYRLSYVVPFQIGIGRPAGAGSVTGRVYDAGTGEGLEGVVVMLGSQMAMTDDEGVFVVARPPSGTVLLEIDRLSAGIGRVPMRSLPIEVPSGTEAIPEIEIPMLQGARLEGVFEIEGATSRETVQRAVVELEGAGGRYRAVSDRDGRFSFEGVSPGDWRLRVIHANLPRHHAVEEEIAVQLSPAAVSRVTVRVRPQQRQIRMVETGTTLVGGSGHTQTPAPDDPRR